MLPAPTQPAREVKLMVAAQPACEVYLITALGESFLGVSGQTLRVTPPCLLDPAGNFVQFDQGTLLLRAPRHNDLRVTVGAQDWLQPRLPQRGSYRLPADSALVLVQDNAAPLSLVLLVGGLGAAAWRRRWTRKLRSLTLPTTGDPMVGRALGGYQVAGRLGQGGMGTVYRVERQGLSFAAKVLYLERDQEREMLARFRREFKVLSRLTHPNLVRAFELHEEQDLAFLVMELVEGDQLGRFIPPGGLGWARTWPLLRQVLEAVLHAHSHGIVHRDLKPANILVSGSLVKVLDFGLARHSELTALTQTGSGFGTPTYMAPEQLTAPGREVEPRSDQYALGVIAYEMVSGAPPFQADDVREMLTLHAVATPKPISRVRPDVPPGLDAILGRMLSKAPAQRYDGLQEVLAALAALPAEAAAGAAAAGTGNCDEEPTQALEPI